MIEKYFEEIERMISYFRTIRTYSVFKKIYNDKQGFINGTIIFKDNSIMEFAEVKDIDVKPKIKYRYHYMDMNNTLIFRYDNAKHQKEIKTFPHHKHIKDKVLESNEMDLFEILLEIEQIIRGK
ncbi:hypothetical protein JW964_26740 [candidate division KSB1 bacterium]|nr:hypothetical protein [candidate division KSB1 bacterium]